jgi:hypothetical protein
MMEAVRTYFQETTRRYIRSSSLTTQFMYLFGYLVCITVYPLSMFSQWDDCYEQLLYWTTFSYGHCLERLFADPGHSVNMIRSGKYSFLLSVFLRSLMSSLSFVISFSSFHFHMSLFTSLSSTFCFISRMFPFFYLTRIFIETLPFFGVSTLYRSQQCSLNCSLLDGFSFVTN